MVEDNFQIKGISQGLLVSFSSISWERIKESLICRIDENPDFFKGARIAIDIGENSVKSAELSKLRDLLSSREIILWAVISKSDITLQTAKMLGLSTSIGEKKQQEKQKSNNTFFEGDSAVWVEKTLRAGYKVETKCHVVIFGDVNPGAEIISAGSIMVWGRLSGAVHAGADGNDKSVVVALEMEPTSLKINNIVANPSVKKKKKVPEIAKIQENQVIIENWENNKNHRGDL